MWIVQMTDIKALAGIALWRWESLSAQCLDRPGTAQPRRMPGEYLMWLAQTVGIEALVGLLLAAGEAHIAFSLTPL
jgi:hypothetical protein